MDKPAFNCKTRRCEPMFMLFKNIHQFFLLGRLPCQNSFCIQYVRACCWVRVNNQRVMNSATLEQTKRWAEREWDHKGLNAHLITKKGYTALRRVGEGLRSDKRSPEREQTGSGLRSNLCLANSVLHFLSLPPLVCYFETSGRSWRIWKESLTQRMCRSWNLNFGGSCLSFPSETLVKVLPLLRNKQ